MTKPRLFCYMPRIKCEEFPLWIFIHVSILSSPTRKTQSITISSVSFQEYDITPSQYALLQCLCTQDGLTPSQLAQELRLDTSSITGILSRLEKKGLIDRVYNQEDRRSVSIHLREEGRSLWSQVDRVIDEANAKITNGLDPEHYAQFLSALSMIERNTIAE